MHVVQLICEQNFCPPLIQTSCSASWCVLVGRRSQVNKTVRDRISQIQCRSGGEMACIAVLHCNLCFVDMEKAFDRVPTKVLKWAMRKKVLSEVMVRAVMSLHDGAKTRVRVGSEYSEEFEVKVGVHQGSVLSPLLFAMVVNVYTVNARRDVSNESLYVDDLCSHERNHGRLKGKILELEGCTGKYWFKDQHKKTEVMVRGSEGELLKRKIDPCGVYG